jgi:hypothetical protein
MARLRLLLLTVAVAALLLLGTASAALAGITRQRSRLSGSAALHAYRTARGRSLPSGGSRSGAEPSAAPPPAACTSSARSGPLSSRA